MSRIIRISGSNAAGLYAIVDDEDYERISSMRWYLIDGYAARAIGGKTTRMHRFLLGVSDSEVVDHVNRNKLDNRRQNLRLCTRQQNSWNAGKRRHNKSGFKGVSWHKKSGKWQASIRTGCKTVHLGLFTDPAEAADVFSAAARQARGEFAACQRVA